MFTQSRRESSASTVALAALRYLALCCPALGFLWAEAARAAVCQCLAQRTATLPGPPGADPTLAALSPSGRHN